MAALRQPFIEKPASRDRVMEPASRLGQAFRVTGVLETDGELHVHGHVKGRIHADRLVLAIGAYVEGDILARDVRIGGRFNGRIFALNVAVDSSAEVIGRVFHHTLTVDKGARIDGRMPWRPINFFESLKDIPEAKT